MNEGRSRNWGSLLILTLTGLLWHPALPAPASGLQGQPTLGVDLERVISELEPEVRRAMAEGRIPSLTMALVAGEEIIWSRGFGEANRYYAAPATPSTIYSIASTLKSMSATLLLQLVEEGRLELDDPIHPYLGELGIRGEDPRDPITFRHLLTHTSGLPSIFSPVPLWADSVPMEMGAYLSHHLEVVGPPGKQVRYSNMGYTLLAYLVERLSGVDFQTLVRGRILGPLGMGSTDFHLTPDMMERLAIPYRPDRETGVLVPTEVIRFAEWPAGGAWGTVNDQARWLAANLNGGAIRNGRILAEETLEDAHSHQFEGLQGAMAGGWGGSSAGHGLGWWVSEREGERYIAHSGSIRGYTAFLHGNRDRRLGVAILTNGHRAHEHLVALSYLATDLMARYSRRASPF